MSPESVASRQTLDARYEESVRVVSFEVGDQRYALDVASVVGIAPSSCEERPAARGPLLFGVRLFRNERAPVVSLRERFGLKDAGTETPTNRVLFVEIDDSIFGLRVDVLHATQRVLRREIEPIPPRLFSESAAYARGAIRTDGRLTLLIDADRLLSGDEKARLAHSIAREDSSQGRVAPRPSTTARGIAPA